MVTRERLRDGMINYIDNEVMTSLPTAGKWIVGTAVTIIQSKYDEVIDGLMKNQMVKTLELVDENGMIDQNILLSALKLNADKYGEAVISIPLLGSMRFKPGDVEKLRQYIR